MTAAASLSIWENAWLEVVDLLDLQLSPLGERAIEVLGPQQSELIVDIGCGAGQTVLQLAERVGPRGQVVGVDISHQMLERARARAAGLKQVHFLESDASQLQLPEKSVDRFFSRFGAHKFVEPIAAFSHLHRLMKQSGILAFVCWRSLEENEVDIMPLRAAGLEDRVDRTPFSFENPEVVRNILSSSGYKQIEIQAYDRAVTCGALEPTLDVLLRVGAVGKIVRENPEIRPMVELRLRAALAPRIKSGEVALNAAVWIVRAVA